MTKFTEALSRWRYRVFIVTWLAYAGYYFCRKNLSVVMPLLEHRFGDTNMQLANVVFGYSLFYALGQFCSGVLSDRFGPRKVVGIGLSIVILANLMMGFTSSLLIFGLLGCLNGLAQSTGWSGLVKNMACWFRQEERGVVMGWWGTNYVVGGFAATVFATWAVSQSHIFPAWGWRRGFWMPALVLLVVALAYVTLVRNRPPDVGLPGMAEETSEAPKAGDGPGEPHAASPGSAWKIFSRLASDKTVWIIGAAFFCVKLTRYAFLFWLPIYMTQQLHYSIRDAGYTSSLYELVGFSGALIAGYASDRIFNSRRPPVVALMMFGLGAACLIHPMLAGLGHWGNALGIGIIGIMTYGPDTLLSGATAQDVGSESGAATAAGFIDGVGSMGQLLSPYVVAFISERYGWDALFYSFVIIAIIGGMVIATRWNYQPQVAAQPAVQ